MMTSTSGDVFEDERKRRLLDWLLTPAGAREEAGLPPTQRQLAFSLGVSERTIRDWKALPQFRAGWEKESKGLWTPDRIQKVLEAMEAQALDPTSAKQVRAAELLLKAAEAVKPPALDVAAKRAAEMSDAELQAMIAQAAQVELAARSAK